MKFPLRTIRYINILFYTLNKGTGRHTWLLSDGLFIRHQVYEADSPMRQALMGSGVLMASGGVAEYMPVLNRYLQQWRTLNNIQDLEYFVSRSPDPDKYNAQDVMEKHLFDENNFGFGPFVYDAVISAGLAACNAASAAGDDYFDGPTHFEHITNTTFTGVSGLAKKSAGLVRLSLNGVSHSPRK